jgi:hypothetical protein
MTTRRVLALVGGTRGRLNGSSTGWLWFWAAALLVLPNCGLDTRGTAPLTNLNRGATPRSSAIFCDIERPAGRRCATPADIVGAIRLKDAAVALVEGRTSTIGGLDDSPAALARCGGQPEVVEFHGPFPEGSAICLNCGSAIGPGPTQHPSNAAVCVADCLDLFARDDANVPPSAEALAFCTPERARLSTNFPLTGCFDGACNVMGGVPATFADPRRHPEPVDWINLDGVSPSGGTLTRTAPTTGFADAGASSGQLIAGGDAYVQFTVTETNTARAAGLSSGPPPPGGIEFTDIGFGILLFDTGEIHVIENGFSVGMFGLYVAGDRFRVKLRDNFDGTAAVSFARLTGPCVDGSPCSEAAIEPPGTYTATYPVRVDAMIREQNGTVTDARIVRIR